MRANFFPDHCRVLRVMGFRRTHTDRSKVNGKMVIYERAQGPEGRVVDVQLWDSGGCRVSHMEKGHGITHPSYFTTVAGMRQALAFETNRAHVASEGSRDFG